MPIMSKAQITTGSSKNVDLAPYIEFCEGLAIGSRVVVPLEEGETSRVVMRAFNKAAKQSGRRLSRVATDPDSIGFRVLPLEKRAINMTAEQRAERAAKIRAAVMARRTAS